MYMLTCCHISFTYAVSVVPFLPRGVKVLFFPFEYMFFSSCGTPILNWFFFLFSEIEMHANGESWTATILTIT